MSVGGINHLTLAVSDVPMSVAFYRDVLGCRVLAVWPNGAYLSAGGTWLALVAGPSQLSRPDDGSHVAFDVAPHDFPAIVAAIGAAGREVWQESSTEGESLSFCDPSGHRLEVHVTTLSQRLASAEADPWPGLVIHPEARRLATAAPTIRDTKKPRRFACFPVGVCVLIFDADDRALLLRNSSNDALEAVSGAVEAGETVAEAGAREVREELGDEVVLGPAHTVEACTVDYDPDLPPLVSVVFARRYARGEVVPADDMAGAEVVWAPLAAVLERHIGVAVPTDVALFGRASRLLALEEGRGQAAS